MTLKALPAILIIALSFGTAAAQNFKGKEERITIQPPQKEFKAGETLAYSLEWLGIPVGKIVLNVESAQVNNRECYHFSARAVPNRFFQRLHDLEYTVDSYVDKGSFLPLRFKKTRRLKKENNFVAMDFDHQGNKVKFETWGSSSFVNLSPQREKLEAATPVSANIPEGTQDLLSSFYYFRLIELKEGGSYPVNIYYNQRNWPLKMRVEKPFIREIRKKGALAAIKIYPVSELNDYILGKRNFSVYITSDSRRIPVEFKLNSAMGPIRGVIQDLPR